MAFWGTEVKPGKPFTHLFDRVRGRLRISQATLGIGSSTKKSLVQCNVGDKSPVFLCALLPDKTESCHLDLEFEEGDEVVFSIIGPRSVYLTGYYVGNSRHSNLNDDTDSYGEDIANTETEEESTRRSDEDSYEDSFIDDDDVEVFPSSPISNGRVVDEEMLEKKKPKDRKGSRKRLKKKYQSVESDDDDSFRQRNIVNGCRDLSRPENEDEDSVPISSLYKSKATAKNVILEAEEKADEETAETGSKKTEGNGTHAKTEDDGTDVIESKRKAVAVAIYGEPERGRELPYSSMLPSDEMGPENKTELNKKNKEQSSERKTLKTDSVNPSSALNEDKVQHEEAKSDSISQYLLVRNEQDQKPAAVKGSDLPCNSLLHPIEVGPETCTKPKKKRKERSKEGKTHETDSVKAFKVGKAQQDEAEADNMDYDLLVRNKNDQKPDTDKTLLLPSTEVASENGTKPKKKRKECTEERKSLEASMASHSNILNEDQDKQDEAKVGNRDKDLPAQNEDQKPSNHKCINIDSNHIAGGDQSEEKKIKMKKKKSKNRENEGNVIMDVTLSTEEKNRSSMEFENKNVDAKSSQARTLSNGLIIEELEKGKPDGKMAAPGKKLKVNYIGKLRENGQIFDSNIGKAPYRFRLGAEEIIEGWNVGVDGMRVGEKRRLIIPPSMGYGSQGAGENIPPNSWLVYDVELLGVR
uniref:peptidylprolyl isomerase n=1 Tax=Davidia involucrata TaxID=16924 RepID=A0A5B6YT91_DAVIN